MVSTMPHRVAALGDSLAVELPTLTRKALVRIQVPQFRYCNDQRFQMVRSQQQLTACRYGRRARLIGNLRTKGAKRVRSLTDAASGCFTGAAKQGFPDCRTDGSFVSFLRCGKARRCLVAFVGDGRAGGRFARLGSVGCLGRRGLGTCHPFDVVGLDRRDGPLCSTLAPMVRARRRRGTARDVSAPADRQSGANGRWPWSARRCANPCRIARTGRCPGCGPRSNGKRASASRRPACSTTTVIRCRRRRWGGRWKPGPIGLRRIPRRNIRGADTADRIELRQGGQPVGE